MRTLNRDLSWLAFNQRVLEEADNPYHPLLERVRFLAITARNLDEFFMVGVAHLKNHLAGLLVDLPESKRDDLSARERLDMVLPRAHHQMYKQQICWRTLRPLLEKAGIQLCPIDQLTPLEQEEIGHIFEQQIFPALTPMAIDPAHPFPHLPNLGHAFVLSLEALTPTIYPGRFMMALVPLPLSLSRFFKLSTDRYVLMEEIIQANWSSLFEGFIVKEFGQFRIVRDSELEIQDAQQEDLVSFFETALKERKRGHVVQIAIHEEMPPHLSDFIAKHLNCHAHDIVRIQGLLGLGDLIELVDIGREDLLFPSFHPRFPERIQEHKGDLFSAIREKDMLLQHPYETFDVVSQFLRQAASDPQVVAIKQTLYRTSHDSPIVKALMDAAENGKSVTALVELKARFDEEANLRWARHLERAGVQVVYSMIGLKTHAKISLVVRREGSRMRRYVHFGTGNYHPGNARIYSDLSLFTCDHQMGEDASHIFNYMTGYAQPKSLHKIYLAPLELRDTLIKMIKHEARNARSGKPAFIIAKMNGLVDPKIIEALEKASQAGVQIDLIIRGLCTLRPGVPGQTENIRVKSIVGRFLEHARIMCFANGSEVGSKNNKVFISSADWMPRNFDHRLETLVPIENSTVRQQIVDQILLANLKDTAQSWSLNADGIYTRLGETGSGFSAHVHFMTNPSLSGRGHALKNRKPDKITFHDNTSS